MTSKQHPSSDKDTHQKQKTRETHPTRNDANKAAKSHQPKSQSQAYSPDSRPAPKSKRQQHTSVPTSTLHPRNPHQGRYDFEVLTKAFPELAQ